jgi:hypothetical protein
MNALSDRPRRDGCPPPVVLEYLAAGDPQPVETSAHVAGCPSCQADLDALSRAAAEFRLARPARQFEAKLVARAADGRRRSRWRWVLGALGATAVAGVVAGVLAIAARGTLEEGVQLKGATGLSVFVLRVGAAQPAAAASGARIGQGDSVRFQYAAPVAGFLMVVDLDGTGRLSAFHPFGGARAQPAGAGSETLPETIAIDAAPGPERIGAIFRPAPFTLDDVRAWVASSGPPPCASCRVDWVVLEKP